MQKKFPRTPSKKTLAQKAPNKFVRIRIDSWRETSLAFAVASSQVAKRRCGNEKHHGVVFEPHRDRAATRPAKTLPAKKFLSYV